MGFFSKSFDPVTDLPDLSGKVILITGGNAGIGYSTVKHLARRGAKVYMAARNRSKAEEAIAQLKAEGLGPGNGDVIWLELDLKDPRNAKKAAEEFMKQEKRLDVLIHNAAVMIESYAMTPDGVQEIVMVNVISHVVLTRTLQPLLDQTAAEPNSDVRIVVVASDAHRFVSGETRFRNLDDFNNEFKSSLSPSFARYCMSKLMNMLYAFELQRRFTAVGSPITVIAIHPGAVNTFTHKPPLSHVQFIVKPIVSLFFLQPDQGAYNSAFAAASEEVAKQREKYKGVYLTPVGKIVEPTKVATDEGLAKELWDTVDKFLEEKGI
ncbi:NAD(P)-binding protein [Suillus fuscotomentosus]|uniref:NAD(P)-binding protein n=1 Tax=Suillus fuscotomentosus TaxID=1912939 RepID=A0AAD4DUT0_9AGAM|nr:NAD(P)-binding protein [Suillus fuscotomentosus]KAG1894323.1 NAD(P)-binding protein [Suillus fuscotomentosus]